jgi:hypothetical protein
MRRGDIVLVAFWATLESLDLGSSYHRTVSELWLGLI